MSPNGFEQFLVLSDEWPVQVAGSKYEGVLRGLAPHPAAEAGLQQFAVLGGTGKFQPQGRDLAIGAPAADGQNPRQPQVHKTLNRSLMTLVAVMVSK